ncbi:N-6 DNA methylase [Kitasatospora sp. NPDC057223]|uniref:N-6 DNA methylase n=1 Tax=Kitasatospora sp. NPDC057223 TaxID=3346055 RepID=UPI00363AB699
MAADESTAMAVVTAAEIARLAGVTRAAVSNWRRRYPDFPRPAAGTSTSPLFPLAEVQQWLERQGKGQETSGEVELWRELRAQHGDDMLTALGSVATQLLDDPASHRFPPLTGSAAAVVTALAVERGTQALYSDLIERCIVSTARSGGEPMSTPTLARIVAALAGPVDSADAIVYDPACGAGTLLLGIGPAAHYYGQDQNSTTAAITELRSRLDGASVTVACGDSLRDDRFSGLHADLVVCEPPVGVADWGREGLLLDPRWELGVPPRSESELAWVQHCYAHTAPGGRTLVVLPASVAYRRAGRRIRAELVRRGLLSSVVALPPGLISNHSLPVHLWELRRPVEGDIDPTHIRMIDLSTATPDAAAGAPVPEQITDVPLIDILDDEVDLSPGSYVVAHRADYPAEYAALRDEVRRLARDLLELLPELPAGPGRVEAAPIGLGDLVRGGLVDLDSSTATSRTEQLDSDYLRGFLRSTANTRRSTTATGTFRLDARSAQLPQMDIERQREYGGAFRRLTAFEERLREVAALGGQASALAFDGLTNGALRPKAGSESALEGVASDGREK